MPDFVPYKEDPVQHIVNIVIEGRRLFITADMHWNAESTNDISFSGINIVASREFGIPGPESDTLFISGIIEGGTTVAVNFPDAPGSSVGWSIAYTVNNAPGVLETALAAAVNTPGNVVDTDLVPGGSLTSAGLSSGIHSAYSGPIASFNAAGLLTGRLVETAPNPTFVIVDPPE